MDVEHYRGLLLAKEKELLADLAQTESAAAEPPRNDVEDEMDMVVRSEAQDSLWDQSGRESDLLAQVRDALQRIEDGTYGKCLTCGRPISEKRLEAVPWAAYDVAHQEEVDSREARSTGGSTL